MDVVARLVKVKMYDWQVEFYKIVGMVSNNHHIKHNKNGHFLVSPAPKQVTNWQNVGNSLQKSENIL